MNWGNLTDDTDSSVGQELGVPGKAKSLVQYVCAQLCPTLVIPWTAARQAPLPIGFSRQEYWGGLPFLPPADLPNPGIKPISLVSPTLASRFFIRKSRELDTWPFSVQMARGRDGHCGLVRSRMEVSQGLTDIYLLLNERVFKF